MESVTTKGRDIGCDNGGATTRGRFVTNTAAFGPVLAPGIRRCFTLAGHVLVGSVWFILMEREHNKDWVCVGTGFFRESWNWKFGLMLWAWVLWSPLLGVVQNPFYIAYVG